MNLFNDNVKYEVSRFDDLVRLNTKIKEVALKFTWLDAKKAEPVLRLFRGNMELLQTLLGDIEGKTVSSSADGQEELFQRAEALEAQLQSLQSDISAWNAKHTGPSHKHVWGSRSHSGICQRCRKALHISKCKCGKYRLSVWK
jgi:hypothetical protein